MLRILSPDASYREVRLPGGGNVDLAKLLANTGALVDGQHFWELHYFQAVDDALRAQAHTERERNGDGQPPNWPTPIPPASGAFQVENGQIVPDLGEEAEATAQTESAGDRKSAQAAVKPLDQVVADDHIVQGSQCIGIDCVDNESFGFDTVRLKENNTRLTFIDTSVNTFPAGDWQLRANESASGAANQFSIDWLGTNAADGSTVASTPFRIAGEAPENALHISSTGRIGLGTSTPVLHMQMLKGDTPGMRLEQTGGGFTPQTWDVAGNEANFFIRDVTSGSKLPLRIRPGAPTSSLDIAADGDLGVGTGSPAASLHLRRDLTYTDPLVLVDVPNDSNAATEDRRMQLDAAGNLFVSGAITQLSSRLAKENFAAITADELLARLQQLPIWTWNYLSGSAAERHIGPVAEDFHRFFGFGNDPRSLSPSDVAGVALAATQALQQQVAERDRLIETLEARLARLEAALGARAIEPSDAPR